MTLDRRPPPSRLWPCRRFAWAVSALAMLLAFGTAGVAAASAGSIFDDDWKPPKRTDAPPAEPPAPRPAVQSPAPSPAETQVPTQPPSPRTSPPATPPPAAGPQRRPVPQPAAQADSRRLLREAFATELSLRAAAGRRSLTRKLLAEVDGAGDKPADQFVLLAGAVDAAREAGNLDLGFEAAEKMGRLFDVDDLAVMVDSALRTAPAADADAAGNVRAGIELVGRLEAAGDFSDAAKVGLTLPRFAGADAGLRAAAQARSDEAAELKAARDRIAPQLEKLKASPADPDANLAAGKFFCFAAGQWDRGLPMLAAGTDRDLKATAERDLAKPSAAADRAAVGDGWWAAAGKETGRAAASIRAHAGQWYTLAEPDLTGLVHTLVEKRLAEIAGQQAAAGAAAGRANLGMARPPAWEYVAKPFCAEGSLLARGEIPAEFDVKYAKGVGSVSGVKKSDAINIGGTMRGHFGKALVWTVPPANPLAAQFRLESKLPAGHAVLVYDSDKGYDPADLGQYHGHCLARADVDVKPGRPATVVVRTDPKTGTTDILVDGKSALAKPFAREGRRPVLLVLAVFARNQGQKVDTTFTLGVP